MADHEVDAPEASAKPHLPSAGTSLVDPPAELPTESAEAAPEHSESQENGVSQEHDPSDEAEVALDGEKQELPASEEIPVDDAAPTHAAEAATTVPGISISDASESDAPGSHDAQLPEAAS